MKAKQNLRRKRRKVHNEGKGHNVFKQLDGSQLNAKISLINSKYVFIWSGLFFFAIIFIAGFTVRTISVFFFINIMLLIVNGFGSYIIIEKDKIIRKGIFSLNFRGKRNIYFNKINDMSVKFKTVIELRTYFYGRYTKEIYIFKNKENRRICTIDNHTLPDELKMNMQQILLKINNCNGSIIKDESIMSMLEHGNMVRQRNEFNDKITFGLLKSGFVIILKIQLLMMTAFLIIGYVTK